jgi:hypothetical protein
MKKVAQGLDRRTFLRSGLTLAAFGAQGLANADAIWTGLPVPTSTVGTMAALRGLRPPTSITAVNVLGYRAAGDGGGGTFYWDTEASSFPAHPNTSAAGADGRADDGGTHVLPDGYVPSKRGRWLRSFSGALNPQWFGAVGQDTAIAPAISGVDVSEAPWNVWPAWCLGTDKGPDFIGFDLKTRPFANTDTWDRIGIQLALFSIGEQCGEVAVPAGNYILSKQIFYSNGMRATLSGAGMYQTILTKVPGGFDKSVVLDLYRPGGIPTVVRDICFAGPVGGGTTDFTVIRHINTNGVTIRDCWVTAGNTGIAFQDHSGEGYVTGCYFEYLDQQVILIDETSGTTLIGNDLWQTAEGVHYNGIVCHGELQCIGNRFFMFRGYSIHSTGGGIQVVDNEFANMNGAYGAILAEVSQSSEPARFNGVGSVISGNRFVGSTVGAMIGVGSYSIVSNNNITNTGEHASLNILDGSVQTIVSGNVFRSHPDMKHYEGGLVISTQNGVGYVEGCSGCLITSNILDTANGIIVDPRKNTVTGNISP